MLSKRRIEILDEDHCAVEILEQRMEALPESYQTPSKVKCCILAVIHECV